MQVPAIELAAFRTMESDFHALNDQLSYCIASQEGLVTHFKTDLEDEIDRLNKVTGSAPPLATARRFRGWHLLVALVRHCGGCSPNLPCHESMYSCQ